MNGIKSPDVNENLESIYGGMSEKDFFFSKEKWKQGRK